MILQTVVDSYFDYYAEKHLSRAGMPGSISSVKADVSDCLVTLQNMEDYADDMANIFRERIAKNDREIEMITGKNEELLSLIREYEKNMDEVSVKTEVSEINQFEIDSGSDDRVVYERLFQSYSDNVARIGELKSANTGYKNELAGILSAKTGAGTADDSDIREQIDSLISDYEQMEIVTKSMYNEYISLCCSEQLSLKNSGSVTANSKVMLYTALGAGWFVIIAFFIVCAICSLRHNRFGTEDDEDS